jgi:DMSO/TMAO reductase YedYZ molybdopterin-dependent catalytic subunit
VFDIPWNGVHLGELFDLAGVQDSATHVNFFTLGGKYNESLPLDVALERNTILAYGVNGSSLPLRHGFPARIVIPRLFGYKSAKYVERIELSDSPIDGFWVERGYPYDGEVPAERLREGKY